MTAKEKAKAYDEALERAKDCLTNKKFKDIDDTPESLTTYIFPELCESEDEKIRKELLSFIESVQHNYLCATDRREKWIAYLEKQKEQKAYVNTDYFKSFMLQYLQDATNKKNDSEIEAATNYWMEKLLGLTKWQKEQKTDCLHPEDYPMTPEECTKPAEWSEEDDWKRNELIQYLEEKGDYRTVWMTWLKSLRSRPKSSDNWKPSEEQMNGLAHTINLDVHDAKRYALDSLYNDLKKLM